MRTLVCPRMIRSVASVLLVLAACGNSPSHQTDGAITPIDAPDAMVDCPTYCNEIQANCTGLNAQYPTMAQCTATCAKFPTLGALTDMTGDTLGCRIYHAGAPSKATPKVHCIHGGPAGAQTNAAAGQCGDACTSFCSLNLATCTGTLAQYASVTTCLTACNGTGPGTGFNKANLYLIDGTKTPTVPPKGDSLACRLYHTTNAAIDAAAATMHCPHTGAVPAPGSPCTGVATP
jgi:hypothetical protein